MNLRYPAVPLVTHSPYFNIWSPDDVPNRVPTCHWTGKPNPLEGSFRIGKREYGFLGETGLPPMKTVSLSVTPCSTEYVMESPEVRLTFRFTSPLLLDDLDLLSRPATYLSIRAEGRHGALTDAAVTVAAQEAVCLDHPGQSPVKYGEAAGEGYLAATLANREQKPLNRAGDDVRIDWGALYLAVEKGGSVSQSQKDSRTWIKAEIPLTEGKEALFVLAYDEIKCIQYFGKDLDPFWKRSFPDLPSLLEAAFSEYPAIARRCREFDEALCRSAEESGGEKYRQILAAAYRQVIAAHGICTDENGELLFISKECFSNGCAATADVSYPSIPLFLLYRPELVFAMMRPIVKYAASPAWPFDFAPHDAGTYPLLNGQVYSGGTNPEAQMPVEECGNMLLMAAAAAVAANDDSFVRESWSLLTTWAEYLREKGMDPENQLCTDDFAGHLAHNCNLSIKAILGVGAYGLLKKRMGEEAQGEEWIGAARDMAKRWVETARNQDGTYRLAFDRPDTFSLKYNAVWDSLLDLHIFPEGTWEKELLSYLARLNPYGVPLDNRSGYTKSDWLIWAASMMGKPEFQRMTASLWDAYNEMPQRVPLGDWYETEDAWQVIYSADRDWRGGGFQNRTVQGGLFLRILWDRGLRK